ncbi:hypothetical protein AVEN_186616-1 [Araneus ventricosus]|uniref:Uncharacterized protein n=1 Tax=Araneus ventricosus TaxID=182803 RepID=A0A4Y2SF98_ARAVE|nr:hypothetical protein AVEN_186616-1 [Araneus ventricosus]
MFPFLQVEPCGAISAHYDQIATKNRNDSDHVVLILQCSKCYHSSSSIHIQVDQDREITQPQITVTVSTVDTTVSTGTLNYSYFSPCRCKNSPVAALNSTQPAGIKTNPTIDAYGECFRCQYLAIFRFFGEKCFVKFFCSDDDRESQSVIRM